LTVVERIARNLQWDFYDRQTGVAKQRAMDRLIIVNQVEALVEGGMTKSAAIAALASLGDASAASIWTWLSAVSGISRHDRLAYLVPRFKGGGRPAAIESSVLDRLAADYLRPEQPSWADCVRRVKAFADKHGIVLPHARTLWRRLCIIYDAPTRALHRGEQLPAWLLRRLPANDR
jgi:putative transposase